MSAPSGPVTAADLLRRPDDGTRQELVRGVVRVMEPGGFDHGRVAATAGALLAQDVRDHALGVVLGAETGFLLEQDPDTVRAPDAAFVRADRVDRVANGPNAYGFGPPDLAIEVVSGNDRPAEVHAKAREWVAAGAPLVVVLDPPSRTATTYRPGDRVERLGPGDELDAADVVAGWRVRVADLFA